MIKIADLEIEDWEDVFGRQSHYTRNIRTGNYFIGRIWINMDIDKKNWIVDFTGRKDSIPFIEAWHPQSFSSVEQAMEAVDQFLVRMQKMIAFV